MSIKAVVFDVFGTVAQIADRRSPYLCLMRWMKEQGRRPHPDDAHKLLTNPVGIAGAARLLGMNPPTELLAEWEQLLWDELASIHLYPDVIEVIQQLQHFGLRVGLCSNLAVPYAVPIRALLPKLDLYGWSFEVGAIKPEPKIYQWLLDQLRLLPEEVLFVGDTLDADVAAPRRAGMQSVHIVRSSDYPLAMHQVDSLSALLARLSYQVSQKCVPQTGFNAQWPTN